MWEVACLVRIFDLNSPAGMEFSPQAADERVPRCVFVSRGQVLPHISGRTLNPDVCLNLRIFVEREHEQQKHNEHTTQPSNSAAETHTASFLCGPTRRYVLITTPVLVVCVSIRFSVRCRRAEPKRRFPEFRTTG